MWLMTDYGCSIVRYDDRTVGAAGAGGKVMATLIPYRCFANDLSNGCLDVSNSTKARRGRPGGLWLRSSVGRSGARS